MDLTALAVLRLLCVCIHLVFLFLVFSFCIPPCICIHYHIIKLSNYHIGMDSLLNCISINKEGKWYTLVSFYVEFHLFIHTNFVKQNKK